MSLILCVATFLVRVALLILPGGLDARDHDLLTTGGCFAPRLTAAIKRIRRRLHSLVVCRALHRYCNRYFFLEPETALLCEITPSRCIHIVLKRHRFLTPLYTIQLSHFRLRQLVLMVQNHRSDPLWVQVWVECHVTRLRVFTLLHDRRFICLPVLQVSLKLAPAYFLRGEWFLFLLSISALFYRDFRLCVLGKHLIFRLYLAWGLFCGLGGSRRLDLTRLD